MRSLPWLTAIAMALQGCAGVSVLRAAVEPIADTAWARDAHSCVCAQASCGDTTSATGTALNFLVDPQCMSSCIEEQRCCGDFFESCVPPVLIMGQQQVTVEITAFAIANVANASGSVNALAEPSPQQITVTVAVAVSGTFATPGQLEFELMQHGVSLAAAAVRIPAGSYVDAPWTVGIVAFGHQIDETEQAVLVALVGVDTDAEAATSPAFGWTSRAFSPDLIPPPQPRAQPTDDVLIAPMLSPITTASTSFDVTVLYATQLPVGTAVLTVALKRGSERIADTQIVLTGTIGTVTATVSFGGVGDRLVAGDDYRVVAFMTNSSMTVWSARLASNELTGFDINDNTIPTTAPIDLDLSALPPGCSVTDMHRLFIVIDMSPTIWGAFETVRLFVMSLVVLMPEDDRTVTIELLTIENILSAPVTRAVGKASVLAAMATLQHSNVFPTSVGRGLFMLGNRVTSDGPWRTHVVLVSDGQTMETPEVLDFRLVNFKSATATTIYPFGVGPTIDLAILRHLAVGIADPSFPDVGRLIAGSEASDAYAFASTSVCRSVPGPSGGGIFEPPLSVPNEATTMADTTTAAAGTLAVGDTGVRSCNGVPDPPWCALATQYCGNAIAFSITCKGSCGTCPTLGPSLTPSTFAPTEAPTLLPTRAPTATPTPTPTLEPTPVPSPRPTSVPTLAPSALPSTPRPTADPTGVPTTHPSATPTASCPANCGIPARGGGTCDVLPDLSDMASAVTHCTSCNSGRLLHLGKCVLSFTCWHRRIEAGILAGRSCQCDEAHCSSCLVSAAGSFCRLCGDGFYFHDMKCHLTCPGGLVNTDLSVQSMVGRHCVTATPTKVTTLPTSSPTPSPTRTPSAGPTPAPTPSPTAVPTTAPTLPPTVAPITSQPTPSPITSPSPTPIPTSPLPTPAPTQRPSLSLTPTPTPSPVPAPTAQPSAMASELYITSPRLMELHDGAIAVTLDYATTYQGSVMIRLRLKQAGIVIGSRSLSEGVRQSDTIATSIQIADDFFPLSEGASYYLLAYIVPVSDTSWNSRLVSDRLDALTIVSATTPGPDSLTSASIVLPTTVQDRVDVAGGGTATQQPPGMDGEALIILGVTTPSLQNNEVQVTVAFTTLLPVPGDAVLRIIIRFQEAAGRTDMLPRNIVTRTTTIQSSTGVVSVTVRLNSFFERHGAELGPWVRQLLEVRCSVLPNWQSPWEGRASGVTVDYVELGSLIPATAYPTRAPASVSPTAGPSTTAPSWAPTTLDLTQAPTLAPTLSPTARPTSVPTLSPTPTTTSGPSLSPTGLPSLAPTPWPSRQPSPGPAMPPVSSSPTVAPSALPSTAPTHTTCNGSPDTAWCHDVQAFCGYSPNLEFNCPATCDTCVTTTASPAAPQTSVTTPSPELADPGNECRPENRLGKLLFYSHSADNRGQEDVADLQQLIIAPTYGLPYPPVSCAKVEFGSAGRERYFWATLYSPLTTNGLNGPCQFLAGNISSMVTSGSLALNRGESRYGAIIFTNVTCAPDAIGDTDQRSGGEASLNSLTGVDGDDDDADSDKTTSWMNVGGNGWVVFVGMFLVAVALSAFIYKCMSRCENRGRTMHRMETGTAVSSFGAHTTAVDSNYVIAASARSASTAAYEAMPSVFNRIPTTAIATDIGAGGAEIAYVKPVLHNHGRTPKTHISAHNNAAAGRSMSHLSDSSSLSTSNSGGGRQVTYDKMSQLGADYPLYETASDARTKGNAPKLQPAKVAVNGGMTALEAYESMMMADIDDVAALLDDMRADHDQRAVTARSPPSQSVEALAPREDYMRVFPELAKALSPTSPTSSNIPDRSLQEYKMVLPKSAVIGGGRRTLPFTVPTLSEGDIYSGATLLDASRPGSKQPELEPYGNFDILFGPFLAYFSLHPIPRAPCDILCREPMLIGC